MRLHTHVYGYIHVCMWHPSFGVHAFLSDKTSDLWWGGYGRHAGTSPPVSKSRRIYLLRSFVRKCAAGRLLREEKMIRKKKKGDTKRGTSCTYTGCDAPTSRKDVRERQPKTGGRRGGCHVRIDYKTIRGRESQ